MSSELGGEMLALKSPVLFHESHNLSNGKTGQGFGTAENGKSIRDTKANQEWALLLSGRDQQNTLRLSIFTVMEIQAYGE